MCIRDSLELLDRPEVRSSQVDTGWLERWSATRADESRPHACLLYTSDAADERSSVDLGGRRIIKKKKQNSCEKAGANTTDMNMMRVNALQMKNIQ